jgi:hypothetical protein
MFIIYAQRIISCTVTGPPFLSRNTSNGNVVPFEELLFVFPCYGKFYSFVTTTKEENIYG